MTELLLRLFVPHYEKVQDPAVRGRYGTLAGVVGIICNLLLSAAKLVIGSISGSVSITADAVNNLSDAASSIMTLVGFAIAKKKPDEEHPYGHARFEYLTGLAVAALIIIIGVDLGKSSLGKVLHPTPVEFSLALVVVLALSIGVKLWMASFNRKLGKRIDSGSLIATAADSRNDVISTGAVLLAAVVSRLTSWNLDGPIGLAVAAFILYSGFGIAKDTIAPLLGEPPDPELVTAVRDMVMGFDSRIMGIHDLMVHDYGPGQRFATVHIEANADEDAVSIHEMLDKLEAHAREVLNLHLTTHYDPLVVGDEKLDALRERMEAALADLDERLRLHDFRMVQGKEHSNLIFDVVLPMDMNGREKEVLNRLQAALPRDGMNYHLVVEFDSDVFNRA